MVSLFLNDTRVFPEGKQEIKLSRENPYFTQSDRYTLEVSLPMAIYENNLFFESLHRLERTKHLRTMRAKLLVDNHLLINGQAKITQVTEKAVKLQLLAGNSAFNFLSEDNGDFIDELPLGTYSRQTGTVDTGVRTFFSPILDETADAVSNHVHYNLIDIFVQMISHYGFEVVRCDVDVSPWDHIFVASSKTSLNVAHVLPHWSPKTFVDEFSSFFNVIVFLDGIDNTARIIHAPDFFHAAEITEITPLDEYTVEMNDANDSDAQSLANVNLGFDMSASPYHTYDIISDGVRDGAPKDAYDSYLEANTAYNNDGAAGKKKLYTTPVGMFTGWEHDYTDIGEENPRTLFTQIDVFGPLLRNNLAEDSMRDLKICPVAMAAIERTATFGQGSGAYTITRKYHLPACENPTGNDIRMNVLPSGNFGGSSTLVDNEEGATIQQLVEGDASIEHGEKEDRLQVMFGDDVQQTVFVEDSRTGSRTETMTIGFTDHAFMANHAGNAHNRWSLSLNPTDADHYLGELHNNGFYFNMKAKLCAKFLAKRIPDPTGLFIIRNKKYACEKIEAHLDDYGQKPLLTAYFLEMIEQ
jgi:hypothetical protein